MPSHNTLEIDVTEYLERNEFYVDDWTYHTRLPKPIARLLSIRFDATSLYLRARADRIAIHKELPVVFEWEAKTHESRRKHNIALEALPLIHHMSKAKLGVKCLYVYRDDKIDPIREVGFWVHGLPPIDVVMIPDRWAEEEVRWYRSVIEQGLPGIHIVENIAVGGTGDPFVIINEDYIDYLPHWQDLIEAELEKHK